MKKHNLKEMKVFKAIREKDSGFMFCRYYNEVGEIGECGRSCKNYKPRNKIKGICKHYSFVYEPGKLVLIKLN